MSCDYFLASLHNFYACIAFWQLFKRIVEIPWFKQSFLRRLHEGYRHATQLTCWPMTRVCCNIMWLSWNLLKNETSCNLSKHFKKLLNVLKTVSTLCPLAGWFKVCNCKVVLGDLKNCACTLVFLNYSNVSQPGPIHDAQGCRELIRFTIYH